MCTHLSATNVCTFVCTFTNVQKCIYHKTIANYCLHKYIVGQLLYDPYCTYFHLKTVHAYNAVFCPHWSAVVNTDHHSAASDQYSALPDHHSFYQYIYRSSLSRCARVAIVYLALFFLRPMGHGSSHARSRSTQSRAMIKSSQNVHYIEQSNLWVGKAKACARVRACVLRIIE